MEDGLPQPYQSACFIHRLKALPLLTQLSVLGNKGRQEGSTLLFHPALPSVSELTEVLPQLASPAIDACRYTVRWSSHC